MEIIISASSQTPIYEQIINQIKNMITRGLLPDGSPLPSVRVMARELKISALTVKKAYDTLESEGFISTVHGKGSFVEKVGLSILEEEARKSVEAQMEKTVVMAKRAGMTREELIKLVDLIMEE
ncbi:MAG: GntR family transcriptional regulator [Clostridiaceae bacterium]|nr:GntR family transcriptional regulator [Clostridiaceae bacterium]